MLMMTTWLAERPLRKKISVAITSYYLLIALKVMESHKYVNRIQSCIYAPQSYIFKALFDKCVATPLLILCGKVF